MFIDKTPPVESSTTPKAAKKSRISLKNTYRLPPTSDCKGYGFHMVTLDDMFGYVPPEKD